MNEQEEHWTDDDDLIERYVLNKLGAEERNELEDHLRICEVCKRAVRTERLLIAGIRREGRYQFKAELRKKVAALPEKKTPWTHILSAAAIIVILITLGIFNRWFETQTLQTDKTPVLTSPQTEIKEADQQPDRPIGQQQSSPPENQGQPVPAVAEKRLSPTTARRANDAAKLLADKNKTALRKQIASESREATGAAANMPSQNNLAGQPRVQQMRSEAVSLDETESSSLWIEGTILSDAFDDSRATMRKKLTQPSQRGYSFEKSDRKDLHKSTNVETQQEFRNSVISLSQQHAAALPPTQQRLQQLNNSAKVMAKVEQAGNKMELTLYLDSLVDQNDLANATVQPLGTDSLIVKLPHQRIAYRLPAGWNSQLQVKPTK